jgi:Subtilase family
MTIKNILYTVLMVVGITGHAVGQTPVSMSHWMIQATDLAHPDSLASAARAISGVLDHPELTMYILHAPRLAVRDSLFLPTDSNRYSVVGRRVSVTGPWKRFVSFVELDGLIRVPNDTTPDFFEDAARVQASSNWGVGFIGADKLHALGITGQGTIGAGLDTGIDQYHPEFAGRFLWGLNTGGHSGTTPAPDSTDFRDIIGGCNGHGTHTTSTINGATVGMAPQAGVVHYRVFNSGDGGCFAYSSSTVRAINHGVSRQVDGMNVSIGHSGGFTMDIAVTNARNAGSIVCGANGNGGTNGLFFPAASPDGYGSAAVGSDGVRASFSQYGAETDIGAPGVGINGAMPGGGYAGKSGTSMASPTSCGAFLLLFSTPEFRAMPRNRARVDTAQSLLCNFAERRPVGGRDVYTGCGTLNVARAYAGMKGGAATSWSSKNYQTSGSSITDSLLYVCATDVCEVTSTGPVTILRQGTYIVFTATGNGSINIRAVRSGTPTPPPPPPPVTGATAIISMDTLVRYQTISGWEAHAQAGQESVGFSGFQNEVMDSAVTIGLNRIRLEIQSGIENPVDYYTQYRAGLITHATWKANWYLWINDNADPATTNTSGYQWSRLDNHIETTIIPMRQRLAARGESLFVNLNYVSFAQGQGQSDPNEYAELILATFQHMQSKYGFVPNAVEMILEPDNNTIWTGTKIGQAIATTGPRLAAAGFRPEFIAPSTMSMAQAVPYLDAIVAVPGALPYLKEVSYHRYSGVSDVALAGIASRAATLGLRTSMLEHIGSGLGDLYADLTIGNVSSWQQFTIAFPTTDNGAQYFTITNNRPVSGSRTPALSQVFRYVRSGARRINATSTNSVVRPVAFTNVGGAPVVVMISQDNQTFELRGLRPGTYTITTDNQYARTLPNATAGSDGVLRFSSGVWGTYTLVWKNP